MPLPLRHRLLFLPTLLVLTCIFLLATFPADAQPAKERTRQGSGDRSGGLRSTEASSAKAGASERSSREARSDRQGRTSASKSTESRDGSGAFKVSSALSQSQAERPTNRSGDRISAEQQANVQQLQADLQVLAQGVQGADDEIRALAEDLQAMSPHKPDPALVEDLANNLASAVADGSLTPREMAELAAAVDAVLQSAGLSSEDVAVLIQDVEAILEAADVGRAEIQAVVDDLYAIAHSIQAPSGSKTTSSSSSKRRRGRGRS